MDPAEDAAPAVGQRATRAPGRRRGDALVRAIHDAVLAELADSGYASLRMERVAELAGTGKAALYRRWHSRADLVADALQQSLPTPADVPSSGNLRNDLIAVLHDASLRLAGPLGAAMRGLLAETLSDPGLTAELRGRLVGVRAQTLRTVLEHAVARGEIRAEALTERVLQVGPALLSQHFLAHGAPVPRDVITGIVDEVVLPLLRCQCSRST
ncbi:TetR/AcrR family transcriptional regulator [Streptomyces sp. NPDC050704]|uniref:TetR/AcrR family transcriptional regulator n=1 Tax=Streptomyces sp. NPDC050704 TaxID=3157219 RepID=UPI00341B37B2